jgi:hypothetical protein
MSHVSRALVVALVAARSSSSAKGCQHQNGPVFATVARCQACLDRDALGEVTHEMIGWFAGRLLGGSRGLGKYLDRTSQRAPLTTRVVV